MRECEIIDCSSTRMVQSINTGIYPESRSRSRSISTNFQKHSPPYHVDGHQPQQFQPNYSKYQPQYQTQSLHLNYHISIIIIIYFSQLLLH